jgi:hypothetical protein
MEMPKRVVRAGKWVWEGVKKIPKALWRFGTQTLPRWIEELAKWIWDLMTVRIPKAISAAAKWIWELMTIRIPKAIFVAAKWIWSGISSLGKAAWDIIRNMVSLLHTVLQAIITFLRNVTLRDVWNGFCDILRAIFITFPTTLWSWIQRFGVASFEVMKTLFGWFGEFLWWIGAGLTWLVVYIPSKLWIILQSLGSSIAKGWSEFMVCINPKL